MSEIFNGFISWDSKFWTTMIPLLTKPGKVSRDYIEGKRSRYSNPFQFYLTVSVIFFLLIGLTENYEKLKSLNEGISEKRTSFQIALDSLQLRDIEKKTTDKINEALQKLDSANLKNVTTTIPQFSTDTVKVHRTTEATEASKFADRIRGIKEIFKYQRKNPDTKIDDGLDSLKIEKTFFNRFLYDRSEVVNSMVKQENRQNFLKQLISYASISLFVFLPLFTLFLKLFYIRRKYTYVEHLIFVFHTQTVFFLLLPVFYFINFIKNGDYLLGIFFMTFLIYLFIAMRKFYQQGVIKTFIKFVMLNMVYMVFATIGVIIVGTISFMLY